MIGLAFLLAATPLFDLSSPHSRGVMAEFAECMARSYNRDARLLVAIDDASALTPEQRKSFRPECLFKTKASALRGGHALYRYALAEALIRRDYRKTLPPDPALAAPITHPILAADAPMPSTWAASGSSADQWSAFRDRGRAYSVVSAFGDCVVRAAPAKSWALLQTKVTSAAEKAAMAGLSAEMGSCVPAGTKIELSPNNIRGTIALNYYRLSQAPRAASGGTR